MNHISAYIISLFFVVGSLHAQDTTAVAQPDPIPVNSIVSKEKFGLRVGTDLYKLARTAFDDNYSGFELMADYRVIGKWHLAVELGNEQKTTFDDNITSKGSGSYFKLGFDYNMHNNWAGLNNMIHGGLRYGLSAFSQELIDYTVATTIPVFGQDTRTESIEYNNLNAQWLELVIGVKAEVLNNLFLSINLQLKRRLGETQPDNFENLYIPGFNRTYEDSSFGVGFGYGISYLIPFYKK